jgi:hypothetical protein
LSFEASQFVKDEEEKKHSPFLNQNTRWKLLEEEKKKYYVEVTQLRTSRKKK